MCTVYSVQYMGYCLHCIVCSIWGTVYAVYCKVYGVMCTVYNVQYMGYSEHCIAYSIWGIV